MSSPITVVVDCKSYTWDGNRWYGTVDYMAPPQAIAGHLNELIAEQLAIEDTAVVDRSELLNRAKEARAAGQLMRAAELTRRVHESNLKSPGVAASLCSILRELRRPQEALEIADRYRGSTCTPLLTSRAATLCDLGRWDEGLRQIRVVLTIDRRTQGIGSLEALAVYARIGSRRVRFR